MAFYVLCESVRPGLIEGEVTAELKTFHGKTEFVRAPSDGIHPVGKKQYLDVGVVRAHSETGSYLIQLPSEADSGANRIWVKAESVMEAETEGVTR